MATHEAAAFAQRWVGSQVELERDVLLVVAALQRDSTANICQFGHVLDDTRRLMNNFSQGEGIVYQSRGQQCCTLLGKIYLDTVTNPLMWFEERQILFKILYFRIATPSCNCWKILVPRFVLIFGFCLLV